MFGKLKAKLSGKDQSPAATARRVVVMGMDCMEPSLVFERWRGRLPTLGRLMDQGTWGRLTSTIPCITIPAWAAMLTSQDPGQLGLYGFHNRPDHSYRPMTIANATAIKDPWVWDLLGEAGKRVAVIGVPPSYPPQPVNGVRVGCFLTPGTDKPFTWPPELSEEIRRVVGGYMVDVKNFRTEDKGQLLTQLYAMTESHFTLIEHLLDREPWDFFMFVEIGVDRIHHGLWRHHDPSHPRHDPANPYVNAIRDYYLDLDARLGRVLARLGPETAVWVVSDHGARSMVGGFCVNQWLIDQGLLVLESQPEGVVPLDKCRVDWAKTKVWGGGGYYGRLFFNVKGREPMGVIEPGEYESFRDSLIAKLQALVDHEGKPMGTKAFKPQDLYRQCRGVPPDLIVYFGDLDWRAVGTLGHGGLYTFANDTGPDDANHAQQGLFIHYDPLRPGRGEHAPLSITDIAPAILTQMGQPVPPYMVGRAPDFIVS